jgi:DNA-binding CsgD family transcriptional regulator
VSLRPAAPGPRPAGLLTGRERQIAALVGAGMSHRDIAQQLGVSKRTVDAHLEHIFGKLGISSRVQLAAWLDPGRSGAGPGE